MDNASSPTWGQRSDAHNDVQAALFFAEHGVVEAGRILLEMVRQQGKGYEFVQALSAICQVAYPHAIPVQEYAFDLMLATPKQIAAAFRQVME